VTTTDTSAGSVAVTFLPGDPPRTGRFALYERSGAPLQGADADIEVAIRSAGGRSVRRRRVRARTMSVAEALDRVGWVVLDELPAESGGPHWAAAVASALALIARGRLYPSVTEAGWDTWRAGPIGEAERHFLTEFAGSLPPPGHALAIDGASPLRIRSPQSLARALWDAIADTLPRTAAAPLVVGSDLFAAAPPVAASHLGRWLADASGGLAPGAGIDVSLRVELDTGEELGVEADGAADGLPPIGQAVLQLGSKVDPSLVVDAADLYESPAAVIAAFGEDVEGELLRSLRRGARAWPPMDVLLHERAPIGLDLGADLLADLMTEGVTHLAEAGIAVTWPAGMLEHALEIRASVGASGVVTTSGLSFDDLVSFRWEATLDGIALSADEIDQLAEAKRGLVRLRGRFVALDPDTLARLRTLRSQRLSAAEALGLLLGGTIDLDGEPVQVVADEPMAALLERIRGLVASDACTAALAPPPGLASGVNLRPYQVRGVAWLRAMTSAGLGVCLADDMGLGKTLQVIALHLHRAADANGSHGHGATLVVCPTSLLGNWEREIARFAPATPVRRFHGAARSLDDLEPGEVVLTSYGVVRREVERLRAAGFAMVVADEAQHAKNPETASAKALRRIGGDIRLALTGTPVENRLSELWAILDWTTPGLLGTLDRFIRTVARPVERDRDPEATERLARVVRPFLLRRRKTDPGVAPDLPERIVSDVPVPLTKEQATLYEAEVREAMAAIRGQRPGIGRQALVLKLLTALKQVCNHPAQYLHQKGPLAGRSGKMAALEELVDVIVAEGESVIVFSQFVECLSLLELRLLQLGVQPLMLHGSVRAKERMAVVDAFQAGESPVMLLSLKAGGVGLNLTRATHVVHYDRWWNPAVEDQATDRAHRIGQTSSVQVHRLMAEGTLEDRIATIIESKRELAESVVGGGESWIGKLSDTELADLVSLGSNQ
jgi:superfamily II DNA or RNA helicase